MGKIEKIARITKLKRNILQVIGGIGVLSVAVIAPNALQALKIFGLNAKNRTQKNFSYWRSIRRLEKDGLVSIRRNGNRYDVNITPKGNATLSSFSFQEVRKKKRWDRRWRMIIFDIPEKKRVFRTAVRARLVQFGFFRLQDSVWVFPYDCEEIIAMLKTELSIGRELLYIVADAVEGDEVIRSHFSLH